MSKKGIFLPTYSIFLLLMVMYAIYVMYSPDNNLNSSRDIGYLQNDIYNLYGLADTDKFYLTNKINLSSDKSISEFSSFEWFYDKGNDINDFNKDLEKEFIAILSKNLNVNADIEILNDKIMINKEETYKLKSKEHEIEYKTNITIINDLKFPISKFILLKESITSNVQCLKNAETGKLDSCINKQGLDVKAEKTGSIIAFTILGDKETYTLENNNLKKAKPVFKFELDMDKASSF